MIALDTNVVIRFLTRDDEAQYKKAVALFKRNEVFIRDTVVLECEWVLRYAYNFMPDSIRDAFTKLFGLPNVHLSNANLMAKVIEWHSAGLDFADALHLGQCLQREKLFTFDDDFLRKARGRCNCEVVTP